MKSQLDAACPSQLSGEVSGVLTRIFDGVVADEEVRFHMSSDATIAVRSDAGGAFYIPCVYPSLSYRVCVGPLNSEQCFELNGPKTDFEMLLLP
jgi:hypothetical protein